MTGTSINESGDLNIEPGYVMRKDSKGVYIEKELNKRTMYEGLMESLKEQIVNRKSKNGEPLQIITSEDIELATRFLIDMYSFITVIETDSIFMYVEEKGIYEPVGEVIIKSDLERFMGKFCKTNFVTEVVNKIKRKTYKSISVFVNNNKSFICMANGVWSLNERVLLPHSEEYYFINRLNITYDPKARCNNISQFFNTVVPEDKVNTLYEIVGFCLMPEYKIQKAVLLVGAGRNGKSVYLNLLKEFLGKENVSCESIQKLSKDKFSTFQLFGKTANIFPDLSAEEIDDSSTFKTLTSGLDSVSGEQKFKDKFSFINNAKLLFSCNQIPKTKDISDAFFRRWVIITFPFKFEGINDNKNLINELTTPEELSGLFNLAIEYYYNLELTGDIGTQTVDDIRELYTRLSDPVGSFILDKITVSGEDYIVKEELYQSFGTYCREHKFPVMSEKMFSALIFQKLPVTNFRASTSDGKRPMCWKGIGFKALQEGEDVVIENFK